MKLVKIAFVTAALALSAAAHSQTDTTGHPSDTTKPGKPGKPTHPMFSMNNDFANVADTIKPDTVKSSYNYAPTSTVGTTETNNATSTQVVVNQPNFGRYYIPVLGTFTSQSGETKNVTIQGDEQNPGKIWIEGLTTEKIYALRKGSAGTYKIPSQKINENKIPEGTVLYDATNKEVRICLGHKFVDSNPSEAFTTPTEETTAKKNKNKVTEKTTVITFIGTKTDAGTAKM